jgi:transcriptional regulator with XRE-family HTH domain
MAEVFEVPISEIIGDDEKGSRKSSESSVQNTTPNNLGQRIKKARLGKGLTQGSLGEKLGTTSEEGETPQLTANGTSDSRETFKQNLQQYMVETNKTQKEVSKAIGVSVATFSSWYNGRKYPRPEKLGNLADYFGVSVSELVRERTDQSQQEHAGNAGRREVFRRNLQQLMDKAGITRKRASEAIGVSYSTFNGWYYGNAYPRLERLEEIAEYFGVDVTELVGEQNSILPEKEPTQVNKNEVVDIILRLHTDEQFLNLVERVSTLNHEKLTALKQFLTAFED